MGKFSVVVVRKPDNFKPRDWTDIPNGGPILETIRSGIRRRQAEGLVFGFNSAAMAKEGGVWALAVLGCGATGGATF